MIDDHAPLFGDWPLLSQINHIPPSDLQVIAPWVVESLPSGILQLCSNRQSPLNCSRLQLLLKLGTGPPQSIKQLTMNLPVTRLAVTKHLRVLESAEFVTQEPHGRERRFVGRLAVIEEAQKALSIIAAQWEDALLRLKHFVEE